MSKKTRVKKEPSPTDAKSPKATVEVAETDLPVVETDVQEQLRAELDAANDRALRSRAELENYRKRAARELTDARRYADLPLMRDLLPVLDNIDRAIEAAEKTHNTADMLEGVKIVAEQFEEVLKRRHCVQIEAINEPFDPHLHEAISQQPSDEHPPGIVVLVTQTGFLLYDRVVRPSQVIVSTDNEKNKNSNYGSSE